MHCLCSIVVLALLNDELMERNTEAMCFEFMQELLPDAAELKHQISTLASWSDEEVVDSLGTALWDVFSGNHTVHDSNGIAYELGTWRGSADLIAEALNERYPSLDCGFGYMHFYMGSGSRGNARLTDLYRWIFSELKCRGCDWTYSFPRVYIVDLRALKEPTGLLPRDPSEAVRAELEEAERTSRFAALQADLDADYAERLNRAADEPLPLTVAAYREVFGHLPDGWPG